MARMFQTLGNTMTGPNDTLKIKCGACKHEATWTAEPTPFDELAQGCCGRWSALPATLKTLDIHRQRFPPPARRDSPDRKHTTSRQYSMTQVALEIISGGRDRPICGNLYQTSDGFIYLAP
jgi:hypothetical protein